MLCVESASSQLFGYCLYQELWNIWLRWHLLPALQTKGSDRVLLRRIREASKEGQDPSNRCEMIKASSTLLNSSFQLQRLHPFAHLETQILSQQRASFHFHICLQFIFVSARLHHHFDISVFLKLRLVQSSLQFFSRWYLSLVLMIRGNTTQICSFLPPIDFSSAILRRAWCRLCTTTHKNTHTHKTHETFESHSIVTFPPSHPWTMRRSSACSL